MTKTSKKVLISSLLILVILLADQVLKIWVKSSFYLGEEVRIFDFFRLYFVENNGMAFGIDVIDKKYLTIFRIFASFGILYYLWHCIKKKTGYLLPIAIALIFAGAVGNIIDCVFYGAYFGYAPYLYGKVVDMLYFPIIQGHYWEWIPSIGGEAFTFFAPVFNIADAAITIGVAIILLFERKSFE